MSSTLEDKISAVACAVAVLEGTDGGYSPRDKSAAKMTLMQLKSELLREWQDKQSSTPTES